MTDAKVAAIRAQWVALRKAEQAWLDKQDFGTALAYRDAFYRIKIGSVGELLAALEQAHKALADIEELTPTEQPTQPDPTGVYGYRLYVAGTVARAALKAGDV